MRVNIPNLLPSKFARAVNIFICIQETPISNTVRDTISLKSFTILLLRFRKIPGQHVHLNLLRPFKFVIHNHSTLHSSVTESVVK